MKAILVLGSESDREFAAKIENQLSAQNLEFETHVASAHKNTRRVLALIESFAAEKNLVWLTIAGRSNALSGVVAANCTQPVIACPPHKDKLDFLVNINSTLQMPSGTPVLTILDPGNCALAVKRILDA